MSDKRISRNIVYLQDRSGTGAWRQIWPINSINCIADRKDLQVDYTQTIIQDPNFYRGMNSVTVQRWTSPFHLNAFTKFLKPLMDQTFGWLVYEEDDLMFDGTLLDESKRDFIQNKYGDLKKIGIPLYNRGRKAFEGRQVQENIRQMLLAADLVTVTTDYLKEIYHDLYDVPMENIVALPNLLPRYLYGDRYDPAVKIAQFQKNRAKPRIGIVSSLSHYNVSGVRQDGNGGAVREKQLADGKTVWLDEAGHEVRFEDTEKITDDFDDIADMIRRTVKDFQYVCFGYAPPQIDDLVKAGKIEVYGGQAIMNYPSMLERLGLQAVIAPIKKTPFNYCKSFIKTMECAAIGVPLFATNCLPYSRVMDPGSLFDTQNELEEKLRKLKFLSSGSYRGIIEKNWKWLNSPIYEGDFQLKNLWLEDNLDIYVNRFRLKQKTIKMSLASFVRQTEARRAEQEKKIIARSESGEAVITL